MNKKLQKHQINYILIQLIAFTFICVIAFANNFISYEFTFIKIGLMSFTVLTVVIYEIIVAIIYHKARKNALEKANIEKEEDNEEEIEEQGYNEHFLWFEIILLLDILILIALISPVTKDYVNISIPIVVGFVIYYIISIIVKPYFGIKNKK